SGWLRKNFLAARRSPQPDDRTLRDVERPAAFPGKLLRSCENSKQIAADLHGTIGMAKPIQFAIGIVVGKNSIQFRDPRKSRRKRRLRRSLIARVELDPHQRAHVRLHRFKEILRTTQKCARKKHREHSWHRLQPVSLIRAPRHCSNTYTSPPPWEF